MIQAQIYRQQGFKQKEIAEKLGISERTVRNHLNGPPERRKKRIYGSKLDPYKKFIEDIIENIPGYNCILLFERIQKMGYAGGLSILRNYVHRLRKKILTEAVRRFETEPGFQAQVDWVELGKYFINGRRLKIYGFVMTLGYSRKSFVYFTTSMKQSVLHACHVKAFQYFGGVPCEILYDNMKTAFICDGEGNFYCNQKLLAFAHHYGFVPRRCAVRRPQTKGKVERFIGYLQKNFMPRIDADDICLESLNESVLEWLVYADSKTISGLNESRSERFEPERKHLLALPQNEFDSREIYECRVNRESCITFETNRYSVPPSYIGENLTLKADFSTFEAEVFWEDTSIRKFQLTFSGEKKLIFFPEDKQELHRIWERQRMNRIRREKEKSICDEKKCEPEVEIRSPAVYESLLEAAI